MVLIPLFLLLITRNVARQLDWHDGLRLYSHDINQAQNAFDLENNYGVELVRIGAIAEAKPHFEKSIAMAPRWWTPPSNLGVIYQRMGDEVKAMELYQRSIDLGNYPLAYENLANLMVKRNDSRAAAVIKQGLEQFPYNTTLLGLARTLK